MLSDDLSAATARSVSRDPAVAKALSRLGQRVRVAHRFVLDKGALQTALEVGSSPAARLIDALPLCLLPHDPMWIEYAYADENEWVERYNASFGRKNINDAVGGGELMLSRPMRCGILLESLQDGDVGFYRAHRVDQTPFALEGSPFDYWIDTRTPPFTADLAPGQVKHVDWGTHERLSKQHGFYTSYDEVMKLGAHGICTPSPYYEEWFRRASRAERENRLEFARNQGALIKTVLGILALLNTRNLVAITDAEPPMPRAPMRPGATPQGPLKEVRLDLSRVQRARMEHQGGERRDARAHVVRGHFKVRNGKLFWWSAHMRGVGTTPGARIYATTV